MFALIAVLMAVDTVIDYRISGSFAAQTFEMLVFAAALAGIAIHGWQLASARSQSERLGRELTETRADAEVLLDKTIVTEPAFCEAGCDRDHRSRL